MARQNWKIVITDCDHGDTEEEEKVFAEMGAELVCAQLRHENDLIRECKNADGLLIQYALITRRVLENLPKCQVVARYGVGVDSIDLRAATDLGIVVANVPDYCTEEVALQAISLLLSLMRKTPFFDRGVKSGRWEFRDGAPIRRIRGKTLGLIGCGRIGFRVARIAASLGLRVIAYDPYLQKVEGVELLSLEAVLSESEFISIHCPLEESTRHLIGKEAFGKMKKRPLIVNTARGPIIDEGALVDALKNGAVSGAGLDVLENEPPGPENPLVKMENVILSPHVGFYSEESLRELNRRTAKAAADVLLGRYPESIVNREVIGKTKAVLS